MTLLLIFSIAPWGCKILIILLGIGGPPAKKELEASSARVPPERTLKILKEFLVNEKGRGTLI